MTVSVSINCAQNAYRKSRSAIIKNQKLSYSDDGKKQFVSILQSSKHKAMRFVQLVGFQNTS